jgi:GAF domain-containing protein
MLLHGRVLGVLDVQSENPAAFDEDVIAVFQTIASHIASTIYNARLLDSARKSLTETMVLYRAGQEFTRAHSIREVYRSLWNALTSLARDSGFPNMLLIPSGAADLTSTPWERLIAPDEPQMREDSSESIRTAETIPIRFLRTYAPVPDAETGTPGAQASSSSRENRPSDYITTALVDAAIPAPEISTAAAGGLPFLVMDTTQPSSYPAPFQDLAVRLNSRAIALVPVRSAIGGAMRITALIVSGLSPSTPAGESPSGNAAGSAAGSNQDYIVQTCVSIAELSAGAFVRVAAADVMEKRLLALQSLSNISQYISAEMELLDVYKAIHIEVNRIIGDVNFLIALYDPDTNYIQVPYLYESGQLDVRAIPPFPLGEGLTSILINTHKPLMINENTEERARQLGAKTVGRPSRSWLGVPLVLANQVYGAIIVQDLEQEHRFDEDDQNLLVTLASQVAIAIRTTRLLASVRRQAERQEQLNRITTLIRSSNDMQAVLQIASTELSKALAPAGVARVVTEIDPAPTQSTPTQADV